MRSNIVEKLAIGTFLLLLVCTCTGADGVKGAKPVYSSFECSSVSGADPADVTARSCVLHNVCLERVDDGMATWSYFADPSRPQDVPLLDAGKDSGEIAAMGYRRGLHMRVDVVRDRSYRPRHIVDPARVTVAFCTPTNSYAHFVMDGMFGLHWLLTHYGYADESTGALTSRANIDILDVCRQSKQEKYLRGLFTDTTPSLGSRLSHLDGNLLFSQQSPSLMFEHPHRLHWELLCKRPCGTCWPLHAARVQDNRPHLLHNKGL